MTPLEEIIATVGRVVEQLGDAEASRRAGIPYMTVRDARKNGFRKTTTDTLEKLFTFAAEFERENGRADVASAAGDERGAAA